MWRGVAKEKDNRIEQWTHAYWHISYTHTNVSYATFGSVRFRSTLPDIVYSMFLAAESFSIHFVGLIGEKCVFWSGANKFMNFQPRTKACFEWEWAKRLNQANSAVVLASWNLDFVQNSIKRRSSLSCPLTRTWALHWHNPFGSNSMVNLSHRGTLKPK